MRSLPVDRPRLTVGSRLFCDIVIESAKIAAEEGALLQRADGGLEYRPAAGGPSRRLGEGDHVQLDDATLCIEGREDVSFAVNSALDRAVALVRQIWSTDEDRDVKEWLIASFLSIFGAQWAALLGLPAKGEAPSILLQAGRRSPEQGEAVSHTVIQRVIDSGEPMLVADVQADPALSKVQSIPYEVRSVIAAPLRRKEKLLGVVYLESPVASRVYTEGDRDLLMRLCALAAENLDRVKQARALASDNARLGALHRAQRDAGQAQARIVGSGSAMRRLGDQIRQVASTDVTTLILGETGTGKELVAREIHALSSRREAPFVPVHCMALPDELVEGELFGHVPGAFSGASAVRIGRFEMATGGTLFLDELGELSVPIQVKLLRVLQERTIQRLGEGKERKVDVRLVSATNGDLRAQVARGTFREDLLYRVAVFVIEVPPLRSRMEDLPELMAHYVDVFNRQFRRQIKGVTKEALDLLAAHPWPGNVRELRNVLEQAFVRETRDWISPDSLVVWAGPAKAVSRDAPTAQVPEGLEAARNAFEKQLVVEALEKSKGDVKQAAGHLKISRQNLYKKCTAYGIDPNGYRR